MTIALSCLLAASLNARTLANDVRASMAEWVSSGNFSGVILAAEGDEVVVHEAFGSADIELGTPMRRSSRFYIGSLSKAFTAQAILQLRDEGKLKLDDSVARFVPDFPAANEITIRQLLRHESGLAQNTTGPSYFALATRPFTTEEAVSLFREEPRAARPGTKRIYANPNFTLLALIVERASGMTFGAFLSTGILRPLGLNETGHHQSWTDVVPERVRGYSVSGATALQNARFHEYSIGTGASSLYSTAADLHRWVRFVASREELRELVWNERVRDGDPLYVSTGWDGVGFSSALLHDGKRKLSIVVLANMNVPSMAEEVALAVRAIVSGLPPTLPKIDRTPLADAELRRLAGKYQLGADFFVPNTVLDIVVRGGALFERQSDGKLVALVPIGESGLFLHRSSWGRIRFTEEGLKFYDRFVAKRKVE